MSITPYSAASRANATPASRQDYIALAMCSAQQSRSAMTSHNNTMLPSTTNRALIAPHYTDKENIIVLTDGSAYHSNPKGKKTNVAHNLKPRNTKDHRLSVNPNHHAPKYGTTARPFTPIVTRIHFNQAPTTGRSHSNSLSFSTHVPYPKQTLVPTPISSLPARSRRTPNDALWIPIGQPQSKTSAAWTLLKGPRRQPALPSAGASTARDSHVESVLASSSKRSSPLIVDIGSRAPKGEFLFKDANGHLFFIDGDSSVLRKQNIRVANLGADGFNAAMVLRTLKSDTRPFQSSTWTQDTDGLQSLSEHGSNALLEGEVLVKDANGHFFVDGDSSLLFNQDIRVTSNLGADGLNAAAILCTLKSDTHSLGCNTWTQDEDDLLLKAVLKSGRATYDWKRIARTYFKGTRSSVQCKRRWCKLLYPSFLESASGVRNAASRSFACFLSKSIGRSKN